MPLPTGPVRHRSKRQIIDPPELPDNVQVKVIKRDISQAQANNSGHCPYARALVRSLGQQGIEAKTPRVTREEIRFTVNGVRFVGPTTHTLAERIDRLDAGEGMEPFTLKQDFTGFKVVPKKNRLSFERIGHPKRATAVRQPGIKLRRVEV